MKRGVGDQKPKHNYMYAYTVRHEKPAPNIHVAYTVTIREVFLELMMIIFLCHKQVKNDGFCV